MKKFIAVATLTILSFSAAASTGHFTAPQRWDRAISLTGFSDNSSFDQVSLKMSEFETYFHVSMGDITCTPDKKIRIYMGVDGSGEFVNGICRKYKKKEDGYLLIFSAKELHLNHFIESLKRGNNLKVGAVTQQGGKYVTNFSLKGFTKYYNKALQMHKDYFSF